MDIIATRELATIKALIALLKSQKEALNELGDIAALRSLDEEYFETLSKAKKCGKVPDDPLGIVYSDWQRLTSWSNNIQTVLLEIDGIAIEIDDHAVSKSSSWQPSIHYLRNVESPLNNALQLLNKTIKEGRDRIRNEDWKNELPYPELFQIASVLGWQSDLIISELPEKNKLYTINKSIERAVNFINNIEQSKRAFVSSRIAIIDNSPIIQFRILNITHRLKQLAELKNLHKKQQETISEIERLLDCGQLDDAAKSVCKLSDCFSDLDPTVVAAKVSTTKNQLQNLPNRILSIINSLDLFENKIKSQHFVPPFSLLKNHYTIIQDAEIAKNEIERNEVFQRYSNQDTVLCETMQSLGDRLENVKIEWALNLRRATLNCSIAWTGVLILFIAFVALLMKSHTETKTKAQQAFLNKIGLKSITTAGNQVIIGRITARWISAGKFIIGSRNKSADVAQYYTPHSVVLTRGFFVTETECTQDLWFSVMNENPSQNAGGDLPVENITWEAANIFCAKLTKKHQVEGVIPKDWVWRLPSEAEWEYAARSGDTVGETSGPLNSIAWYSENADSKTHPVGGKLANDWGLFDTLGNVREWCLDGFQEYPKTTMVDPINSPSSAGRVVRGGSIFQSDAGVNYSNREGYPEGEQSSDLGFRMVLTNVN